MGDKWKLQTGIHAGTMTSRDSGPAKEFDTKAEAIADYQDQRNWFKSIGYVIWFAYLTDPDGNITILEQNTP